MKFKPVILMALGASADPKHTKLGAKLAGDDQNHPLLWRALEAVVRHRYERATGKKIGAGFDWKSILDWLIANLPTIIKIIMTLFVFI